MLEGSFEWEWTKKGEEEEKEENAGLRRGGGGRSEGEKCWEKVWVGVNFESFGRGKWKGRRIKKRRLNMILHAEDKKGTGEINHAGLTGTLYYFDTTCTLNNATIHSLPVVKYLNQQYFLFV